MRAKRTTLLCTAVLCAISSFMLFQACSSTVNDGTLRLLVGTYTEGTGSAGVYMYAFDPATCEAVLIDTAAAGNPSFIIPAEGGMAYAVSEYSDGRQAVLSFSVEDGGIDLTGSRPGPGGDPCNILEAGGRIITSDYTGGTLSIFPVCEDGAVGPMEGQFVPSGASEAGSHIHCAVLSPDGKYVFFTDLGRDALYRFDVNDPTSFCTAYQYPDDAGHPGPRHLTFSPDGRFAYLICELGDVLTTFAYSDGRLEPIDSRTAYDGEGHGSADIHVTPDGRFLYTSHRLRKDGIAIFGLGKDGKPTEVGYQTTGTHPRNFAISPDGRLLLCACRDSDCIEIYSIDPADGTLKDTGKRIELPAPVCVNWIN